MGYHGSRSPDSSSKTPGLWLIIALQTRPYWLIIALQTPGLLADHRFTNTRPIGWSSLYKHQALLYQPLPIIALPTSSMAYPLLDLGRSPLYYYHQAPLYQQPVNANHPLHTRPISADHLFTNTRPILADRPFTHQATSLQLPIADLFLLRAHFH